MQISNKMKLRYKIFGCKTNKYFTEKWLESEDLQWKTGVFVASCVVTDKAKAKWVKFVKDEIAKLKWDEKIYLSWCGSIKDGDIDKEFYNNYPSLVQDKDKIILLQEQPEKSKLEEIKEKISNSIYVKKFLVIQTGCDNFCTYCLTVQARWRHQSRDKDDIIEEINKFTQRWGKEVVITWINLWAWWALSSNDFKDSKFAELLTEILEKTTIPRLKISSLWPEFVDSKLLDIFKNKRITPHFHLSIQSWSSRILKIMNRHYDRQKLLEVMDNLKNLDREDKVPVSIWADIIIWFPGETEEDFLDSYDLVKNHWITKLHAFTFSPHVNNSVSVPASKFPDQVPDKIKKERYDRIMKLADEKREEFKKLNKWKTLELLIEKADSGKWEWWSENYIELDRSNFEIISGEIKKWEIVIGKMK